MSCRKFLFIVCRTVCRMTQFFCSTSGMPQAARPPGTGGRQPSRGGAVPGWWPGHEPIGGPGSLILQAATGTGPGSYLAPTLLLPSLFFKNALHPRLEFVLQHQSSRPLFIGCSSPIRQTQFLSPTFLVLHDTIVFTTSTSSTSLDNTVDFILNTLVFLSHSSYSLSLWLTLQNAGVCIQALCHLSQRSSPRA